MAALLLCAGAWRLARTVACACVLLLRCYCGLARGVRKSDVRCRSAHRRLPGNLPSKIRQSQTGAEVAGLIPIYSKHSMPADWTKDEHNINGKHIAWATFDKLLEQLIPQKNEDPVPPFVEGFRCVYACGFG